LVLEDVEKKIVQKADRLMRRLSNRLPEVPQEKWMALKEQLLSTLRRLEEVSSEEEFLALLQEMTITIQEALGVHVVFGPQASAGEPCNAPPAAPDQSPEEGNLESLITFFKSSLGELIEKMEAGESRELEDDDR
jgi:hypothetical protein